MTTNTHDTYTVTGVPPMRSGLGREFRPEAMTVVYRDSKPRSVTVAGHDTRQSAVWVETGYSLDRHGKVKPHAKTGDAPAWLTERVQRAVAIHEEEER